MTTRAGQTASLKVTAGKNVIMSIIGVSDARDSFQFRTENKTYKIMVGQLMRSVTDQPFSIAVSINSGGTSPRAPLLPSSPTD